MSKFLKFALSIHGLRVTLLGLCRELEQAADAAIQSKNEDDLNLVLMKCGSANRAIAERVNNFKVQLGARQQVTVNIVLALRSADQVDCSFQQSKAARNKYFTLVSQNTEYVSRNNIEYNRIMRNIYCCKSVEHEMFVLKQISPFVSLARCI